MSCHRASCRYEPAWRCGHDGFHLRTSGSLFCKWNLWSQEHHSVGSFKAESAIFLAHSLCTPTSRAICARMTQRHTQPVGVCTKMCCP